jgi:hypothetical protein
VKGRHTSPSVCDGVKVVTNAGNRSVRCIGSSVFTTIRHSAPLPEPAEEPGVARALYARRTGGGTPPSTHGDCARNGRLAGRVANTGGLVAA